MMVRYSPAISSSGDLVILTRSAFLRGGRIWAAPGLGASRPATVVAIISVRSSRFMDSLVVSRPPCACLPLRDGRIGNGRDAADCRCAGRKRGRWDEEVIPLRRGRTAAHAGARERIDVRIGLRETGGKSL